MELSVDTCLTVSVKSTHLLVSPYNSPKNHPLKKKLRLQRYP
jgi:hypothetical protein